MGWEDGGAWLGWGDSAHMVNGAPQSQDSPNREVQARRPSLPLQQGPGSARPGLAGLRGHSRVEVKTKTLLASVVVGAELPAVGMGAAGWGRRGGPVSSPSMAHPEGTQLTLLLDPFPKEKISQSNTMGHGRAAAHPGGRGRPSLQRHSWQGRTPTPAVEPADGRKPSAMKSWPPSSQNVAAVLEKPPTIQRAPWTSQRFLPGAWGGQAASPHPGPAPRQVETRPHVSPTCAGGPNTEPWFLHLHSEASRGALGQGEAGTRGHLPAHQPPGSQRALASDPSGQKKTRPPTGGVPDCSPPGTTAPPLFWVGSSLQICGPGPRGPSSCLQELPQSPLSRGGLWAPGIMPTPCPSTPGPATICLAAQHTSPRFTEAALGHWTAKPLAPGHASSLRFPNPSPGPDSPPHPPDLSLQSPQAGWMSCFQTKQKLSKHGITPFKAKYPGRPSEAGRDWATRHLHREILPSRHLPTRFFGRGTRLLPLRGQA